MNVLQPGIEAWVSDLSNKYVFTLYLFGASGHADIYDTLIVDTLDESIHFEPLDLQINPGFVMEAYGIMAKINSNDNLMFSSALSKTWTNGGKFKQTSLSMTFGG